MITAVRLGEADLLLLKPFTSQQLIKTVRKVLDGEPH